MMREFMDIVESSPRAHYRYVGNCTNSHMAPYLSDMMEQAKQVSYRTLISAVGRSTIAAAFPDFDWSHRPKDLTMANDMNVSYYRSEFDGSPCFYVRESGIEHVFVDINFSPAMIPIRSFSILSDGTTAEVGVPRAIFTVGRSDTTADVSQSTAATKPAAKALGDWLVTNGIESVDENGDVQTVAEYLAWLETV